MNIQQLSGLLQQLQANEEDARDKPYEALYAEADRLDQQLVELGSSSSDIPVILKRACIQARRGLVLSETDLQEEAEAGMQQALPILEANLGCDSQQVDNNPEVILQNVYNALGALWCRRGDFDFALDWLAKAEEMAKDVEASTKPELSPGYTTTMFFLAQVFAHKKDPVKSAKYCGDTLQRQLLDPGKLDRSEWVQNCSQLAGYYANLMHWPAAEVCVKAARLVATGAPVQQSSPEAIDSTTMTGETAGTVACDRPQESQQGSVDDKVTEPANENSCDTSGDQSNVAAAAASGVDKSTIHPDTAGEDTSNRDGADQAAAAPPVAGAAAPRPTCDDEWHKSSSVLVDPDVAANLMLAHAKLLKQQLAHHAGEASVRFHQHTTTDLSPDALPSFPVLGLTTQQQHVPQGPHDSSDFSWDQARALFNSAVSQYNAALEYYKLDGWVTDHCNILMDISHCYKLLTCWETSATRRAAMHKQRAARLKEVCSCGLNPQHFLGLIRSVQLESGNAWRDCLEELRDTPGVQAAKIKEAITQAASHYKSFLATYDTTDQGVLPDKVPEEEESFLLNAALSYGRLLSNYLTDRPALVLSYKVLEDTGGYIQRNNVSEMFQEAELANELASLVKQKLDLSSHRARAA